MSTANANAATPAKPKSKKLLFILIGVVVLALAGAGGAFFILKKNMALDEDGGETSQRAKDFASRSPPTFLPLEAMVVNLADPGGNRFAQLGITLQVQDDKTAESMTDHMPTIRDAILMLISQRTTENMFQREGKKKLSADIVREISRVMGLPVPASDEMDAEGGEEKRTSSPLQAVLFSSFLVQ